MVKKTVGKVEVDFSNSREALEKIRQLNEGVRIATVNVEKLKQVFDEAPRTINNFIKELNKVNEKGHLEGSVTSRQKQALDVRSSDLEKLITELSRVTGANRAVDTSTHKEVDSSTLKSLNDSASRIVEMLSRTGVNSTIDRMRGTQLGMNDTLQSAYSHDTRDYNKRADYTNIDNTTLEGIKEALNGANAVIKEARGVVSNNNRTLNNIETTRNSGNVTYNRNRQYENFFGTSKDRLAEASGKISGSVEGLNTYKDKLLSREEGLNEAIRNSSNTKEAQDYEKELNAIKTLRAKVENKLEKLSAMDTNIKSADETLGTHKDSYNDSIKDGSLKVGVDPSSFMGRLRSQSLNIAQRALGTAQSVVGSAIGQGTNTRMSAYENGTGSIMMGLASQDVTGRKMDDHILQILEKTGINNGTHYSGAEMTQFANSYVSSNRYGSVKDYNKQADSISQMARFSGMSSDSANSLISTAGISGVTDMTNFTKVVSGSLQNANMTGRSSEMANALSSILSNTANIGNMSQRQASSWASLQGMANSTHNSDMQGQQGANAINAMTNGLTNTNSAWARQMFAQASGNTGRYSGREGAFNLSLDMEQARKDPTKLSPILKQLDRSSSGNTSLMAAQLQSLSGGELSATQAKHLTEMYKNGDFTKEKLQKVMKKDSETSSKDNKGKEAYGSSGKSTLDFSIAVDEKGNVQISKATDSIRGLKANVKNATGVLGGVAMDVTGNIAGNLLANMISSKGGIKGSMRQIGKWAGTTKIGKKLGKTKLGKKVGSILGKSAEKATEKAGAKAAGKVAGNTLKAGVKKAGPWAALLAALQLGNHEVGSKDSILNKLTGNSGSSKLWGRNSGHNFMQNWGHNIQAFGNKLPKYLKWLGLGSTVVGGAIKGVGNVYDDLFGEGSKAHADSVSDIKKKSKKKDIKKNKSTYTKKQKDLLKQFNAMLDKAEKVIALAKSGGSDSGSSSDSAGDVDGKHSGTDWKDKIKEVAKAMGQNISDKQVETLQKLIMAESGGNEKVGTGINDHDGTGLPVGLLQYKKATWDAYKVAGHDDINSGVDQLYAFFNNSNWANDLADWDYRYNTLHKTGWGPHGSRVKNARGGLVSRASLLGNNNIVGEDGTELVLPMNSLHGEDGKKLLNNIAGNFGSSLVDNGTLNKLRTSSEINVSPNYSINVSLSGNESDDEVASALQRELDNTRNSLTDKLTNYYSQDLHTAYY